MARTADESPYFVCPSDLLLDVAKAEPRDSVDLQRIANPLPPLLGDGRTKYALQLLACIQASTTENATGALRKASQAATRGMERDARDEASDPEFAKPAGPLKLAGAGLARQVFLGAAIAVVAGLAVLLTRRCR